MVSWVVKDMGGEVPRQDDRLLQPNLAAAAVNCDLAAGPLDALPSLTVVKDLSGVAGTILRAYRFPGPNLGDPDIWLPLPSPYSSVVRSPLANDTSHRVYWTSPSVGPKFATYTMLATNTPPYDLGFTQPDITYLPVVTATGGTTDGSIPLDERSYCVTFTDNFGLESAPSDPSAVVSGAPDGTWTIVLPVTGLPSPGGKNYPPVQGMWLYRTVTGQNTGATFYRVHFFDFVLTPPPALGFVDGSLDTDIVNNLGLESASWAPPPANLDGLIGFPGGMLIGFTGSTLHFCEPNRPHAWPAGYDISVKFPIQALGVWQQSVIVLTQGSPSSGSGTAPANFTLTEIQVAEPCIARGSVITDLLGVYYASQNGLVMLNYFGMQNQTLQSMTKNIWLTEFVGSQTIACRHRAQYLALGDYSSGIGFIIDYTEQRLGIVRVNSLLNASCVWNDPYTGDTYIIADKKVYLWDNPTPPDGPMVYRWKSKEFYLPAPVSLGACQISASSEILDTLPTLPPLDNTDSTLALPTGVNALFRLYAHGHLVLEKNLTQPREIFRLPGGFKAFDWQFELVGRVPIFSVELATTMGELSSV